MPRLDQPWWRYALWWTPLWFYVTSQWIIWSSLMYLPTLANGDFRPYLQLRTPPKKANIVMCSNWKQNRKWKYSHCSSWSTAKCLWFIPPHHCSHSFSGIFYYLLWLAVLAWAGQNNDKESAFTPPGSRHFFHNLSISQTLSYIALCRNIIPQCTTPLWDITWKTLHSNIPCILLLLSSSTEYTGAFQNKTSRYKLASSNIWTRSTFQGKAADSHKPSNM